MDAPILPACQADFAVAARMLPRFKHIERSEEADQAEVERPQEVTIFLRYPGLDHDLINDEIIPLRSHRGYGVPHTAHGTLKDRAGSDGDDRLAILFPCLEKQAVAVGKQLFW